MNRTMVLRRRRRSTAAAQPSLVISPGPREDCTPAGSAGYCLMPELAHAFTVLRASALPGPTGTSERATPAEPVRFCMMPEVAHAFAALRATRLPVTTKAGESFAIEVRSSTVDSPRDALTWELVSSRALSASSNAAARQLLGVFSRWSPARTLTRRELPGHRNHTELAKAQQPGVLPQPNNRHSSWQLLRQHQFRLYFLGSLISNLGTWLQSTAQIIIAYQFTHSVFTVGLIASAQFAGMVVVSPWAAVLASKYSPRTVLCGTQCASAIIAALMALCYLDGTLRLPELFFGALSLGFAYALALPVQTALVPKLVGRANRTDALKMNSVSYNAGRALAPALSVLVIAFLGPDLIFVLNAITFVTFALVLCRLDIFAANEQLRVTNEHLRVTLATSFRQARKSAVTALAPAAPGWHSPVSAGRTTSPGRPAEPASAERPRARLRDGLDIALHNRRIVLLLAIVAAVTLADDPILVLSPALAHTKLHISNDWAGYFIAALGWGSVLGSLPPTSAQTDGGRRASRYAAFSLLALGVSVVAFTRGFSAPATLAAAVAAGAAGLCTGTAAQTALLSHQEKTGASMATAASITALWAIAWAGTKPFASLLDGWLASHLGLMRTGIILASPALTIALCELLLPSTVRKFIKSRAARVTSRMLSTSNTAATGDVTIISSPQKMPATTPF
jgi:MFS family permease